MSSGDNLAGLAGFIRPSRMCRFTAKIAAAFAVAVFAGCRTPMPPGAATSGLRLGPFFETARDDSGSRLIAVRPFYSRETAIESRNPNSVGEIRNPAPESRTSLDDPTILRSETDLLWPLGIRSQRDDHYYWRALLFYGTGTLDDPTSPNDPWRFRLFPFIYAGRTQEGEDYAAVFPLGGTIRDFLVFHETSFVLFPIYAEGRSPTGVEMRTILWPFYLTRHGERIDQFRLWPFYGTAERRNLHATGRSRFVLWPIWSDTASTGEIEGSGFVLFPIFGHSRFEREKRGVEESWSVIPPLFLYARGDDGYRKLLAPWPFIRFIDNDGLRERHIWPLWGRTERWPVASGVLHPTRDLSRSYFFWPFFSRTETERAGVHRSVLHAPLPFFFRREETRIPNSEPRTPNPGGESRLPNPESRTGLDDLTIGRSDDSTSSFTRLWPLFSWRRTPTPHSNSNSNSALRTSHSQTFVRVPELSLWSKSEQVERNWAPLWSLYTYRKKPSGAYCNDLLWGLLSWGRNDDGGPIFSLLWIPFAR